MDTKLVLHIPSDFVLRFCIAWYSGNQHPPNLHCKPISSLSTSPCKVYTNQTAKNVCSFKNWYERLITAKIKVALFTKLQFAEEGPTSRVESYKLSKTLQSCERSTKFLFTVYLLVYDYVGQSLILSQKWHLDRPHHSPFPTEVYPIHL